MCGAKSSSQPAKSRLDRILVERGLAETLQESQGLIMAGRVRVNGQQAMKPGTAIRADADIQMIGEKQKYASRAGRKLEGALEDFRISADGAICLDIGASNGGFTDCLLRRGARRVYAVDVNTAQLDFQLQHDSRVIAIKKNARYLKPNDITEAVDFVTIDVSFISVAKILDAATALAKPGATFLILVKPQFELPKRDVKAGGVVTDPALHERAIAGVRTAAERAGLEILGVKPSRLAGAEGNQEFFLHARRAG
jgi:23S rRNA (cytidine1920-2'-O)/16S rRNA (cytidine1409-2'-O)-methyltransferase